MFAILRERRARRLLARLAGTLVPDLERLSPRERAEVAIVANAMLLSAGEEFGRVLHTAPAKLPPAVLVDAVLRMADQHRVLVRHLGKLGERPRGDLVTGAAVRQLRAVEVVVATVGSVFEASVDRAARRAWRVLSTGRDEAEAAVRVLEQFERETGRSALPEGIGSGAVALTRLATLAPPVMRAARAG